MTSERLFLESGHMEEEEDEEGGTPPPPFRDRMRQKVLRQKVLRVSIRSVHAHRSRPRTVTGPRQPSFSDFKFLL